MKSITSISDQIQKNYIPVLKKFYGKNSATEILLFFMGFRKLAFGFEGFNIFRVDFL